MYRRPTLQGSCQHGLDWRTRFLPENAAFLFGSSSADLIEEQHCARAIAQGEGQHRQRPVAGSSAYQSPSPLHQKYIRLRGHVTAIAGITLTKGATK